VSRPVEAGHRPSGSGDRPLAEVRLEPVLDVLLAELGPQGWWPAHSAFEMMVGAILVQNTSWRNVETSITNLAGLGLLDPASLLACGVATLTEAIRPSGFMTAKTRACRGMAEWYQVNDADDGRAIGRMPDDELRRSLLALPGVGPETADVISLYAFGRRVFVADAYARRVLRDLGFAVPGSYPATQTQLAPVMVRSSLSEADLGELHGLLVAVGKLLGSQAGDVLLARLRAAV